MPEILDPAEYQALSRAGKPSSPWEDTEKRLRLYGDIVRSIEASARVGLWAYTVDVDNEDVAYFKNLLQKFDLNVLPYRDAATSMISIRW